jgi:hypothetical protein
MEVVKGKAKRKRERDKVNDWRGEGDVEVSRIQLSVWCGGLCEFCLDLDDLHES